MLIAKPTTAFRKDIQRLATRERDIVKMLAPLIVLLNGGLLSPQYRDHSLKGIWCGYRDFHVEPDWIVTYRITENFLVLERTGTHSELFKK